MDETAVRQRLLDQHGIRVEPEMGRYVFRKLSDVPRLADTTAAQSIPVIGVDARTGVAVRQVIDLQTLHAPRS